MKWSYLCLREIRITVITGFYSLDFCQLCQLASHTAVGLLGNYIVISKGVLIIAGCTINCCLTLVSIQFEEWGGRYRDLGLEVDRSNRLESAIIKPSSTGILKRQRLLSHKSQAYLPLSFPASREITNSHQITNRTQSSNMAIIKASVIQSCTQGYGTPDSLELTLKKLEELTKIAKERDGSQLAVFPEAL